MRAEQVSRLRISASAVKTRQRLARTALRARLRDYQPERHAPMNADMVPVTISGVVKTTGSGSGKVPYYIGLAESGGDRLMWIGVGEAGATALALSLSGSELPRPTTYQFTAALLTAAGATLQEIRVTRLTDGIFYAQVLLSGGAVIDARPSDALNLAAVGNVPVLRGSRTARSRHAEHRPRLPPRAADDYRCPLRPGIPGRARVSTHPRVSGSGGQSRCCNPRD